MSGTGIDRGAPTVDLAAVLAVVRGAYPESLAESWDTGIGLTCGDPAAPVRRVLLAVDADADTVAEAIDDRADLLLTHHPLLFRPVQSVAADTAKGALLHRLIRAGVAHVAAHTNADSAVGGVNDALAEALGLVELRPLRPHRLRDPQDKIVVAVPVGHTAAVIAAMAAAGAGGVGRYTECAFSVTGTGQFRPNQGARPAVGSVGALEQVAEDRVEMIAPLAARAAVLTALRAAHPYEEAAVDVLELAADPTRPEPTGLGRIGILPEPMSLRAFATHVAGRLPATVAGVRAAGDPDRLVRTVAVCGGAGDSELDRAAAAGVDAYVTSDLRHHPVAEHVADPARPAVVDVAHWAGEWPWLGRAARLLEAAFPGTVVATVSTRCTDPWTVHAPSPARPSDCPAAGGE
ncbi:Nif3-like dinuclear metal center hexameric protein [Nakamurella leprariae]|uniref:GTP cyclohydrolase 1 type 2 homolog n=1 Tax=Nakamurella leprariae TaxID=2803911 RepID=A0A938YC81_9ACTN|nr:Nif3-like dinuclear metal center hexameric protein [Nakamurella leprariae]MBM9466963.1 Nif3-like dinuclear metal center hexameric protein [Nakamurella leprariae]